MTCNHTQARSSAAQFVATTRRRRAWAADYSEPGWRLLTGTCRECGSNLDILLPTDHPVAKAAIVRTQIDREELSSLIRIAELEEFADELEGLTYDEKGLMADVR